MHSRMLAVFDLNISAWISIGNNTMFQDYFLFMFPKQLGIKRNINNMVLLISILKTLIKELIKELKEKNINYENYKGR